MLSNPNRSHEEPTSSEIILLKLLKKVYEYLSLEDFALRIFRLNKRFYNIINTDPFILCHLAKRYYLRVQNPHPNHRKYFQLLTRRFSSCQDILEGFSSIILQLTQRLIISKNLVKNPYGKIGYDGWELSTNGSLGSKWAIEEFLTQKHRTHCFSSSYVWCVMSYEVNYSQLSVQARSLLEEGRAVIKFGCYIARRCDFQAQGYFELKVYDSSNKILHDVRVDKGDEDLPEGSFDKADYSLIVSEYLVDKDLRPDRFVVTIGGKDKGRWHGNFGMRFSGVFARCDLREYMQESVWER